MLSAARAAPGLGRDHLAADQLDHRHRRVVALARPDLRDAGVPAVSLGELRGDHGEQLVHHALVGDYGHHVTAGVQVTALGEGDQPLGNRAQPTGLGLGGGDLAVLEQRGGKVPQQVPLVGCTAA